MEITIYKTHGRVKVNVLEIEMLVQEQLKMVPGITSFGNERFIDRLKMLTSKNGFKSVHVYPLAKQSVGIDCHVKMVEGVNFSQVAKEAQSIIKFSVEKKYGLTVEHVDIIIEGFIER